MNQTWKAVAGIILIFILGWFGGAVTTLIIARHKGMALIQHEPEALATLLERLTTRNLGLDEGQEKQLHALFVENLSQRMELQKQIQPQVRSINNQTLQEINAVLTPTSKSTFTIISSSSSSALAGIRSMCPPTISRDNRRALDQARTRHPHRSNFPGRTSQAEGGVSA